MSVTTETPRRLLDLRLRRPAGGVSATTTSAQEDGHSFHVLAENEAWLGTWYEPREQAPDMLQEFIELPAGPNSFAGFASRYGMLGLARMVPLVEPEEGVWESQPLECIADWELTQLELRTVGELHGALSEGNELERDRLVQLDGDLLCFSETFQTRTEELLNEASGGEWEVPDFRDEGTDRSAIPLAFIGGAECEDGDRKRACWDLLACSINSRTEYLIGYGLRWPDHEDPETLELSLSTKGHLISWLWLQMAEQVANGRPMKPCLHCGTWFFQHPESRRQHGIYCSSKCRVAAYRARQRRQASSTTIQTKSKARKKRSRAYNG